MGAGLSASGKWFQAILGLGRFTGADGEGVIKAGMDHPCSNGVGDLHWLIIRCPPGVDGLASGSFDAGDEESGGRSDARIGKGGVGKAKFVHRKFTPAQQHGRLSWQFAKPRPFAKVFDFIDANFQSKTGHAVVLAFHQSLPEGNLALMDA